MPAADDAGILRAAEADRDQARVIWERHRSEHPDWEWCEDCVSFEAHVIRTQRQVELLLAADAGMDVMW